jgi:hypothetical protein
MAQVIDTVFATQIQSKYEGRNKCWLLGIFKKFFPCAGWGYIVAFTKVPTIYQIYLGLLEWLKW